MPSVSPPPHTQTLTEFNHNILYDELISCLRKDDRLIVNGELVKNKIVELALNFDSAFIDMLGSNELIQQTFFAKTGDVLVFDKQKFHKFIINKQFLPNSYTSYKNRIGLKAGDNYLGDVDDVVLIWPYKDCVLEGGQTKEEQKRKEIFWNEILAPDEIDVLLEPKVLTKFKRHEKDSTCDTDAIKFDDNLIIRGNNLLVLHCLSKRFTRKVKLIYIDPPYNTGGAANTFSYNNSFNHSTWLTFMKNRLEVGRELLREDGFIAIAIDQHELFYLGLLADEVFGRENRLGIITVVNNPMGRNQAKFFSTTNDFMLVYAKNHQIAQFNSVILNEDEIKSFSLEDKVGKYKLLSFIRTGGGSQALRTNKPKFWYPIYVDKKTHKLSLDRNLASDIEVYPVTETGQERTWKTKSSTTQTSLKNGDLVAKRDEQGEFSIYRKYRIQQGKKVNTVWSDSKYNANHKGVRLLEKLVGKGKFKFPKSLYTVQDVLKIMTSDEDLILDFFAGSGTTGHAALLLNKEDGGNRKFILVEQIEEHIRVCEDRIKTILIQENIKDSVISCELALRNAKLINKIENTQSSAALVSILKKLPQNNSLSFRVIAHEINSLLKEFLDLSIEEQKQILIEMLDKNQLYVNYSEIDDQDHGICDQEKELNKQFYGD